MTRFFALLGLLVVSTACAADGNRLAYLDGPLDPYYPHRDFPKLITPQWVGEEGVECVVTLAIDDMRDSAKYEAYLRPILDRLKQIDGRAALSIMSCRVDPADPQLQAWLKEGLSIEVHTFDHPCPCLQDGGLVKAKETYDKCVDLMNAIPGNKPVAFRMPCCDSKNTPSPRFWAEAFNKTTAKGHFLQIDSSVFNIITNKDKSLPKEITELPDGSERFRRYVPFANFVNTIEDYPYPYVIGGMCWEFPCVTPSDWSAQFVQKPNNPDTVRDWKLALDACVLKQGTFNLVFHPHGWIRNDQIVELIDHAVTKHGKKVKFLTFKECAERLNSMAAFSSNSSLRQSGDAAKQVTVADLNNDGFLDLLLSSRIRGDREICRIETNEWQPSTKTWKPGMQSLMQSHPEKFGVSAPRYVPLNLALGEHKSVFPSISHPHGFVAIEGPDDGFRLRDINGDGVCESIVADAKVCEVFTWSATDAGRVGWNKLPFSLPSRSLIVDTVGRDAGIRLIDVNGDGKLDCLFSNAERYSLHLFKDMKEGWATKVIEGVRGKEEGNIGPVIPPFVRTDGTNNGAWFHSGALWLQNEDTWKLPDNVFKLTFAEMLGKKEAGPQPTPAKGAGARGQESGARSLASNNPKSQIPNPQSASPSPTRSILKTAAQLLTLQPSTSQFNDLQISPPKSPEEALKSMHLRPGMQIELVAAEPLVIDPVAFDWGPDGRLWVVEMRDYPSGITWKKEGDEFGKPGGRVKVLTDVDGDGRYDKAAVFLDEIPFPTGVKVWRKGILVTAAPDILYAEDTNGDDKADERKVLYRGFGEGNQQHRVNGLRWGLDNWLHVGNGDSGGIIKSLTAGLTPARSVSEGSADTREINVNGRDLRIRPDTGELDATSGNTQFGRERDDWGNWFGGNNSDPMWHYVLDDYYLRRNPHTTYPPVKKQVSVSPGASPVFPKSKTLTRFNDENKANRFTSACSPIIYRDDLLGADYYGNSFVCEPVHNLVHREIVTPSGVTFTSRRADDEQTSEFLASDDNWFRPSMCRTGPDGALWVADMYRFVIEHPKWIPTAAQNKLDLRAGDDKGRIYRIYPTGKKPRPIARLDKLDTAALVAALDSPNGPQRDLAHQMLIWRGDKAVVESLQKLVTDGTLPQTRVQALCTLDGLQAARQELLLRALADQHPGVRRHAVRLYEPLLRANQEGAGSPFVLFDTDPLVRMQVAYALGESKDPRFFAQLIAHMDGDAYVNAALLSSVRKENIAGILESLLKADKLPMGLIERLLVMAAAMGEDGAIGRAATALLEPQADGNYAGWQFIGAANVADALSRRKVKLASVLEDVGRDHLRQLLDKARSLATNTDQKSLGEAVAATSVLARGLDDRDPSDVEALTRLLAPQKPPELKAAAVAALARTSGDVPKLLLTGWAAHSPALRSQILDALTARQDWSLAVLDAIEKGQIPASQLDARRRQQFLTSRIRSVRERAEKVLAGAVDPNRQKLVESYITSVTGGNVARGKAVFAKRCANCHKLEGAGFAVGPDLAALNNRSPEVLLTAILDPNRAVEDRYLEYVVLTTDGRQVNGMLLEETGASLTLVAPEGKQTIVPRGELDQMKSSGKSLMPEGVEKDITPAEMADLVAYLRASAPAPKKLAGNTPQVVQPFVDGSIRLLATTARVYGPTLVLEEKYRNLGYWSSTEDFCAWTFDVPAGGDYRLSLDYACADSAARNSVAVQVGGQTFAAKVTGTGTWDDYRGLNLGTVTLAAGKNELLVKSDGPIKSALLDLRGVRLVPVK